MLIAISQRNDKNKHGDFIDSLENNYINYFSKYNIQLRIIPNCIENIELYLKEVSAIILSGGNDVNPTLYGESEKEDMAISDLRDKTEKNMLEFAIKNRLPVLTICRGTQFLNVFFGGKLTNMQNHVRVNHQLEILKEFETLGKNAETNSYHNSSIDEKTLSNKLRVFAKTQDGSIEGVYHPDLPIAGIQWHPERESPNKEFNEKLIKSFLERRLFWK